MYTFTICHPKGSSSTFEDITSVDYIHLGIEESVSGDALLRHRYPTNCSLHLNSSDSSYTISEDMIGIIEVTKQS